MPRWLRFSLIGCGGLIGIVVLISACAALVGQAPTTPPAAPEKEEAKEEETPEEKPAPAKKEEAKEDAAVTVRVDGAPGTGFQGSYGTPDSTRSVDGVVPQEFDVEVDAGFMSMDIVTVVMQKQSQGNEELAVQVVSGGEVVKEQTTTAPFGVVSLTVNPTELQGS